LDEEIDPLVLLPQFTIKLALEFLQLLGLRVAARYRFGLALTIGGADLDEAFNVIVIHIVWCRVTNQCVPLRAIEEGFPLTIFPERNRSLLESVSVLHLLSIAGKTLRKADGSHYVRNGGRGVGEGEEGLGRMEFNCLRTADA